MDQRLENFFNKLEQYYPEHKVFAFDSICFKLREKATLYAKIYGFNNATAFLAEYGYEMISGDAVKQLRYPPKYQPGDEPDIIKNKVESAITRLEAAYPDKIIQGAIEREHKHLSSDVTGLYQWLGYEDRKSFLEAYGFQYIISNSGRPTINVDEIISILREKTKGGPYNEYNQMVADNPDIAGSLKTIRNDAQQLFGMSLLQYFTQEGIIDRYGERKTIRVTNNEITNPVNDTINTTIEQNTNNPPQPTREQNVVEESSKTVHLAPVWKTRFSQESLKRGKQYCEDGRVKDIEIKENEIEAVVKGTIDYHVRLIIKNNKLTASFCDCPNADEGYLCKHMAAALYHLEKESGVEDTLDKEIKTEVSVKPEEKTTEQLKKIERAPVNKELLDRKVEYWQSQLLDLGKRNKMMHFRETTRTTLNIVSPSFDDLYNRLVINEESLSFRRPVGQNDDRKMYSLVQLLKNLDRSIEFAVGDIETKGSYATCNSACLNLKNKAQLALDEQGTNILYLCFGFVEWRRRMTGTKEEWYKSPLVLVPVKISNDSLLSPYQLKKRDDEIVVNPTLSHFFKENFRIDLPQLDSNPKMSEINRFMDDMEDLANKRGWRISRECCIGLMSFLKITMYNDLVDNEKNIKNHPIIRAFAGEENAINIVDDSKQFFNHDEISNMKTFPVMEADSSQQDAIELSKNGVSFVLQGPPGTGKSQTITNIIAEGIADGKKVLFVSEKQAALDVVYKRLKAASLAAFCLPLHNHKADKRDVINEIGSNLSINKVSTRPDELVKLTQLDSIKGRLGNYIKEIHKPINPLGISLYDAFGTVAENDDIPNVDFEIKDILGISREKYYQLLLLVKEYETARFALGDKWQGNPWVGTKVNDYSVSQKDDFLNRLKDVFATLTVASSVSINNRTKLTDAISLNDFDTVYRISKELEKIKTLPGRWFNADSINLNLEQERVLLNKYAQAVNTYTNSRNEILEHFDNAFININGDELSSAMEKALVVIENIFTDKDVTERREETRERLLNIKDNLDQMITRLPELKDAYGFNDSPTLLQYRNYIQVLGTLLEENPYTEYYLEDIDLVKSTVDKISGLMRQSEQNKYQLGKNYLKQVYDRSDLPTYIAKLNNAKDVVNAVTADHEDKVKALKDFWQKYSELTGNIKSVILSDDYKNAVRCLGLKEDITCQQLDSYTAAINTVLDNHTRIFDYSKKLDFAAEMNEKQKKYFDVKAATEHVSEKHLFKEDITSEELKCLYDLLAIDNINDVLLQISSNENTIEKIKGLNRLWEKIQSLNATLDDYKEKLGFHEDQIDAILQTVSLEGEWWAKRTWIDRTSHVKFVIDQCAGIISDANNIKNNLLAQYKEGLLNIDYQGILSRFNSDYRSAFKALNRQYKEDTQLINSLLLNSHKQSDEDIVKVLTDVRRYHEKLNDYQRIIKENEGFFDDEIPTDYDWNKISKQVQYVKELSWIFSNGGNLVDAINSGALPLLVDTVKGLQEVNKAKDKIKIELESLKDWFNDDYSNGEEILHDINIIKMSETLFDRKQALAEFINNDNNKFILDTFIESTAIVESYVEWFKDKQLESQDLFGITSEAIDYDWNNQFNYLNGFASADALFKDKANEVFSGSRNKELETLKEIYAKFSECVEAYGLIHPFEDKNGTKVEAVVNDFDRVLGAIQTSIWNYMDINNLRFSDIQKESIDQIIHELEMVEEIKENNQYIERYKERSQTIIGELYDGYETDWDRINSMVDTAQAIKNTYTNGINRKLLKAILSKDSKFDEQYVYQLEKSFNALADQCKGIHGVNNLSIQELNDTVNDGIYALDLIKYFTERVNKYCLNDINHNDAMNALNILKALQKAEKDIQFVKEQCMEIMPEFDLNNTDNIDMILSEFNTIRDLRKGIVDLHINIDLISWATASKDNTSKFIREIDFINRIKDACTEFSGLFANSSFLNQISLTSLKDKVDQGIKYYAMIGQTLDLAECEAKCVNNGLGDFISKVRNNNSLTGSFEKVFVKNFYRKWLDKLSVSNDVLHNFKGTVQDTNIKEFIKLNDESLNIDKKRINEALINKMPNRDSSSHKGEISILIGEMNKQSGQLPLRRLFARIPNLLLQLKPCLMMSPLSVSYFLESKKYQFDMVIFDEASQIFPQDAIGAISRGKQVIIVGDTKQLPPTNFFNAKSIVGEDEDYEEDEEDMSVVSDSILEEANNHLISRSLLWHYRSRNEDLISFSNQHIYNGNLVTFPSSTKREPDFGVEYVYVKNGVYTAQTNEEEAKRCVRLVEEHFLTHPDRSLGIIAFSEKQQSLIEEKILNWRRRHKEYEPYFSDTRREPFFVKNLENVQGDERDTIIFSICYAKDATGRLYYRFGPLGAEGGERRLNVAITRAKYNVKLVGSLLPDEIDLEKVSSLGVKQLRSYIDYAISGNSTLIKDYTAEMAKDSFVSAVASYLNKKGYQTQLNVGNSEYKISIAVMNPDNSNQYLVGIECDGRVYHDARTAKDRDDIRPRVLSNMGWNMYHLWSAEWFRNPESEKTKLLSFIKRAQRSASTEKIGG